MMARRDDDFQAYQDRPLYWDKSNKATKTRAEEEARSAGGLRSRGGTRIAAGCGCVIVAAALVMGAAVAGWRQLPPFAVMGLHWIVQAAIDGNLTINNQRAEIPEQWRSPVEATVEAYGEAYAQGLIAGRHMFETYTLALGAVQPGRDQEVALDAFVRHMRGELLPGVAETLPALPDITPAVREASAASAPAWDGNVLLPQAERALQQEKRDQLAGALSRVYGPTSRARILPEGAVVQDFNPPGLPETILSNWVTSSPLDGSIAFRRGTRGFSDTVSQAIVISAGAHETEAALEFSTTAGSVDFWYYFEGSAGPGSTFTVLVDGRPAFTDALPTVDPGNIATAWRQAHLAELTPGQPGRISVLVSVTDCAAECTVYVDDFVFGP